MAQLHATAPAGPADLPSSGGPGLEPCLSPAERAMVRTLATVLRRCPGMVRKSRELQALARSGIRVGEPDPALVDRRARRVVRLVRSRAAADRRAYLAAIG